MYSLRSLIFILGIIFIASANIHEDYPQWDPVHWVVKSTDFIKLECTHARYFPFNETAKAALKVKWILPKHTSYRHLDPETTNEGWTVLGRADNFTLLINKTGMNVPEAVDGMYLCAVLAAAYPNDRDSGVIAWYYFRWGVGLYNHVPAMNDGSVAEKYYWSFTYSWVSCFVGLSVVILYSATLHFKYIGGPEDDDSIKDKDSDIESFSLSSSRVG